MNLSLRTNTLFEQIIREEYAIAKIKLALKEGITTSTQYDPSYKPKPVWATKSKAYNILKKFGANPYSLGLNDDGLELVLYQGDKQNDRMSFTNDGEVYSADERKNFGWKLGRDGQSIDILSDPNNYNDVFGTIVRGTSGNPNNFIPNPAKEKVRKEKEAAAKDAAEYSTGEKVLDRIETVLDWVGFVPVVGDFGDIINAIIKFSRGKVFEGLLSSIAIIPIVGTAMSLGVKTGIKGLSKSAKSGKFLNFIKRLSKDDLVDPKTSRELWTQFIDNKILKKEELANLGKWFETAAEKLKTGTGWIVDNTPLTAQAKKDLLASASEWETFLNTSAKNLDNTLSAETKLLQKTKATDQYSEWIGILSNKPKNLADFLSGAASHIDDAAQSAKNMGNAIPLVGRTAGKLAKLGPAVTNRVTKILAKVANKFGYSAGKLTTISNIMAKKFAKQWDNPTMISTLLHTAPNKKALKEIFHNSDELLKIMDKRGTIKFLDNPEDWADLLESTRKTNPALYKEISNAILSSATDPSTMNPFYAMFKGSQANQLKTMISKDAITWAHTGANLGSKAKWADIIGSEGEDFLEAIGIRDNDEKNGFIVDGIFSTIYNWKPDLWDGLADIKKRIEKTGIVQAAVQQGKEVVGIDPDTYNPEAEKMR
jgi:hypothetical protein